MIYDFQPILLGAIVSAILLTFEHFTLWSYRKKLPVTWRYALGTLALMCGTSVALGLGIRQWNANILFVMAVITPVLVPLPGGALVLCYHWIHWLRGEELEAAREVGMLHADIEKDNRSRTNAASNQDRYSGNGRSGSGTINSA